VKLPRRAADSKVCRTLALGMFLSMAASFYSKNIVNEHCQQDCENATTVYFFFRALSRQVLSMWWFPAKNASAPCMKVVCDLHGVLL